MNNSGAWWHLSISRYDDVPADGTLAASCEERKFGTSPFLGSTSHQSVLGCIDMAGFVNDDATSNSLSSKLSAHARTTDLRPATPIRRGADSERGHKMMFTIEFFRIRKQDNAHATLDRITHIASDLESAKVKAKSLFDTLNMPQTPTACGF
jgi:hypothetical protein